MTTFTAFAPTINAPFTFQPTLDSTQYNVIITWNMSGQRWFFNLYTLNGVLIVSGALVSSSPTNSINLVAGYFTKSTLVFRDTAQQFEVSP